MQEFIIVSQSTHILLGMQITPCFSRCSEQIYILISNKRWKTAIRESAKWVWEPMGVGAGEVKSLKNDWWRKSVGN